MKTSPFLALGLLMAATLPSIHAAENLIPNGDFEAENDKGGVAGWSGSIDERRNPKDIYIKDGQAGDKVHGGTRGMKLYVSSFGAAGQDSKRRNVIETLRSSGQSSEPSIKLEPGKTYKLTFWIKREGFNDPAHNMVVEMQGYPFSEPGTDRHSLSLTKMTGASDWEQKEATFLVPADSNIGQGHLIFRLFFPSGSIADHDQSVAYIDDVVLTRED